MATGTKREITWCFMPSQPERLYQGEERVREVLYVQKTNPQEKSWVEDGSVKRREKVTFRRETGALHQRN